MKYIYVDKEGAVIRYPDDGKYGPVEILTKGGWAGYQGEAADAIFNHSVVDEDEAKELAEAVGLKWSD